MAQPRHLQTSTGYLRIGFDLRIPMTTKTLDFCLHFGRKLWKTVNTVSACFALLHVYIIKDQVCNRISSWLLRYSGHEKACETLFKSSFHIQGGSFVWNPLRKFHLHKDIIGKLGTPIPLLSMSQNAKTQPFHSSGVRFKTGIRKTENMLSFLCLLDILSQNLDSSGTFMDLSTPHLNDQKLAKFGP